jgi:hypothetical protein
MENPESHSDMFLCASEPISDDHVAISYPKSKAKNQHAFVYEGWTRLSGRFSMSSFILFLFLGHAQDAFAPRNRHPGQVVDCSSFFSEQHMGVTDV